MADVINLRQARKVKARTAKVREAETNRAAHGESKAVRAARKAEQARLSRVLDGAKLDHD